MSDLTTSPLSGILQGFLTAQEVKAQRYQQQRQKALDVAEQVYKQQQLDLQKNAQKIEAERLKNESLYNQGLLKHYQTMDENAVARQKALETARQAKSFDDFFAKATNGGWLSPDEAVNEWNALHPDEARPLPSEMARAGQIPAPPGQPPRPNIGQLFLQGAGAKLGLGTQPSPTGGAPTPQTGAGGPGPQPLAPPAGLFTQPNPKAQVGMQQQANRNAMAPLQQQKTAQQIKTDQERARLLKMQTEMYHAQQQAALAEKKARTDKILTDTKIEKEKEPLQLKKLNEELANLTARTHLVQAQTVKEKASTEETRQRIQKLKSENQEMKRYGGPLAYAKAKGGKAFVDLLAKNWAESGKRKQASRARYEAASKALFAAQGQMDKWNLLMQKNAPGQPNADHVAYVSAQSALTHLTPQLNDLIAATNDARASWQADSQEYHILDAQKRLLSTVADASGRQDPKATHQMHQQAHKDLEGQAQYTPPPHFTGRPPILPPGGLPTAPITAVRPMPPAHKDSRTHGPKKGDKIFDMRTGRWITR